MASSCKFLAFFSVLIALIIISSGCKPDLTTDSTDFGSTKNNSIIIGWQKAWAPSGQIAQVLRRTNIGESLNLDLCWTSFVFGPDINEAALDHEINCLNIGIVPAISLLAQSDNWLIVGRLIRQPLSVVAANGSGINSIKDLRAKVVGVPFGSNLHPYLLNLLEKNHLWDGNLPALVQLENIFPSEQIMALQQKHVQAIVTGEPLTSIALQKKLGKIINQESSLAVIVIEKKFAIAHPDLVTKLLKAYLLSNFYTTSHRELADTWFAKEAQFSTELINKITIIEPNLVQRDPKKINLDITADDLKEAQSLSDMMFKAGLIKESVQLKDRIDLSYLKKAEEEWQQTTPTAANIKIVQP